jgi:hypothetical protein
MKRSVTFPEYLEIVWYNPHLRYSRNVTLLSIKVLLILCFLEMELDSIDSYNLDNIVSVTQHSNIDNRDVKESTPPTITAGQQPTQNAENVDEAY